MEREITFGTIDTTSFENWVYLVTNDFEYGLKLSKQIKHFGYHLQLVKNLSKLENTLAEHRTTAILIDLSHLLDGNSDSQLSEYVRQLPDPHPPIFFLSERSDQALRMQAIRADGLAFFSKPANIISLIDKLDALRYPAPAALHRVLIILSQPTLASYYEMILKRGGFVTGVAEQAENVLERLDEFNPDLILMDINMPQASSLELFKMIRQIEAYVSVPIVILAGEADYELQMELMRLGGDDFITKPVRANQLISTLENRLERSRVLRAMMARDILTGLLNHTNFRERLNQEINRGKRQNARLALGMIDIDRFKRVNDTYGHTIGDSVLKSLSRLLQQRLRKTDIIGRYGGEEFVVALLDASEEQAFAVLDEIRNHFAQIQHYSSGEGKFTVTFSCGIASFPRFPNAIELSDAADRALYAAKAQGRNRVVIADHDCE